MRGIDPAETLKNLDGVIKAGRKREIKIIIIGLEAPGNFGPKYRQDFDAIYPKLVAKYGLIFVTYFIRGLMDRVSAGEDLHSFYKLICCILTQKGFLKL